MQQLFHPFDAEEICKIKIPRVNIEDCVAWHYEKNGGFSVRSAYRLAAQLNQQDKAIATSSLKEADERSIGI